MILNAATDIVVLLAVLVGLVVIHEFGHFIVARRANVKVHEFGIGFPPRARRVPPGSGDVYSLNWLPIGGFVRLEGEEGESADPRAFVNQGLGTRLAILLAGVVMNFLLAWLIFSIIAGLADPIAHIRVASVQPGSPAASIELQGGRQIDTDAEGNPIYDESGDLIVAIDGRRFPIFEHPEQGNRAPLDYLRARAGDRSSSPCSARTAASTTVPVDPPSRSEQARGRRARHRCPADSRSRTSSEGRSTRWWWASSARSRRPR